LKNKKNKNNQMMIKKHFTKDEQLLLKKYPRLMSCGISYPVVNRAYKRYLSRLDEYMVMHKYPKWWFSKDKDAFCNAVYLYICAKESRDGGVEYIFGTRGFAQVEMVKLSGLDKFL